jgi:hypothetical protein
MPDKDDIQKQREEGLLAEALQKQERMKLEAAGLSVMGKKMVTEETVAKFIVDPSGIDWEAVRKAYKAAYGEDLKNGDTLAFGSRGAALTFFADLAKKGLSFLAEEMIHGLRNGFHVFSYGSGKFYSGTLDVIKEALEMDLKQAPENKKLQAALGMITELNLKKVPELAQSGISSSELRDALKEHRDREEPEGSSRPTPPVR